VRAEGIDFTPPYVLIEGTYAVPVGSPLKTIEDVDHAGVKIAVAKGSAYDLFLTRAIRRATLLRAADTAASVAMLEHGEVGALAGVKQPLVLYANAHPAVRVIPGRFMDIEQAMTVPKGRPAGFAFVRGFVEAMKASGFVARELAASGQADATVAPAAGAP
jgi:polar amino acid transport system substrate-binding protein